MAWYHRHKGWAGAAAGFALGSYIPLVGNAIGAIVGAFAGPSLIPDEHEDDDQVPPAAAKGEPHRSSS